MKRKRKTNSPARNLIILQYQSAYQFKAFDFDFTKEKHGPALISSSSPASNAVKLG